MKWNSVALVAIAFAVVDCRAADDYDKDKAIKLYTAASLAHRDFRIERQQQILDRHNADLAAASKGVVRAGSYPDVGFREDNGKYQFQNKKAKDTRIANIKREVTAAENEIASLRREKAVVPEISAKELAVGKAGRIVYMPDFWPNSVSRFKVVQVVDGNQMLVLGLNPEATLLWVKGVKTDGIVDDADFNLDGPFVVTGTTTYNTAGGATKKVFVIEPFDTSDVSELPPIAAPVQAKGKAKK